MTLAFSATESTNVVNKLFSNISGVLVLVFKKDVPCVQIFIQSTRLRVLSAALNNKHGGDRNVVRWAQLALWARAIDLILLLAQLSFEEITQ